MKLYQKVLVGSVIALASLFSYGCGDYKQIAKSDSQAKQTNQSNDITRYNYKTYFTSFGELSGFNHNRTTSPIDLELGDLDGDGDLDAVLTDRAAGIVWAMENRIPQKNKEAKK